MLLITPTRPISTGTAYTPYDFIATAGQTVFSVVYDTENTSLVQVYINGIKAKLGDDFTLTLGTTLTLTQAAEVGDLINVLVMAGSGVELGTAYWSNILSKPTTISGYGITDAVQSNVAITDGTATKITYDAKGLVTAGTTLAAGDIPDLSATKITSGTLAVARGGTGVTTSTGTGSVVLSISPDLTGTPTAPTATVGTNTTQIATTAFVLANAGSMTANDILTSIKTVDGDASGLDADLLDGIHASSFSRTTHNHTLDALSNTTITSNTTGEILKWNGTAWVNNTLAEAGIAPLASPALTGTPTAPTAAVSTNTTQVATTAFVLANRETWELLWSGGATSVTHTPPSDGNVWNYMIVFQSSSTAAVGGDTTHTSTLSLTWNNFNDYFSGMGTSHISYNFNYFAFWSGSDGKFYAGRGSPTTGTITTSYYIKKIYRRKAGTIA